MRERVYARNHLKRIRKALGVTLDELAARMEPESTASTIAKLENRGMGFTLDYVMSIAKALGVPPTDILDGGAIQATRLAPVIGRVSAGRWQEAVAMSEETIAIPGHLRGENLFVLRPEGDSMDRICSEDGFIVVDPDQRDLIDKKYYVLTNGEHEALFKQFSANPLQLLPCSTNPDHKPIPLGAEPFVVIGRVVYVGQEL